MTEKKPNWKVDERDRILHTERKPRSLVESAQAMFNEPTGYGHRSMADHGVTRLAAKLRIFAVLLGLLAVLAVLLYRGVL